MKRTKHAPSVAVLLLVAFAICPCMGCAGTGPQAAPTETAPLSDSPTIDGTPLLGFEGDAAAAKLVSDMEAGRIPVSCDVLYDQMGSLPNVVVTDPDTITHLFKLVEGIVVTGESDMSVTDSYHHVRFTLQDGTVVGYSFEGEGLLSRERTNYEVVGDGPLWEFVRQLQDAA